MTPTRRAVAIAAALAVGALVLPAPIVVVGTLVLALAIAIDTTFARRGVRLLRRVNDLAIIGIPTPVRVDPIVRGGTATVRVRQPRTPDLRVEPGEADGPLDAWITPLRRGNHVLPAVAARQRGPLGLAAWDYHGEGSAALTVFPDVPNARRVAALVRTGRFRESGSVVRGPLGIGTEFEAVREYLPDDDARLINWAASVRTGEPMSNVYRVETDRQVVGLVDCGRLMLAPVGELTRLDAAIDAVTMLAFVADELGDRSGVVAFDREIRRRLAARRRGADGIVRAIYDLEPRSVDSDYDLAFRSVRNLKRAMVVVLTDLLDAAAAASLVDAVPLLARRHAVVIASVTDPDVAAAIGADAGAARDTYRAVAALDVLAARARAVAALRGAGAHVIDAPPERLGEACVATYLKLKESARL